MTYSGYESHLVCTRCEVSWLQDGRTPWACWLSGCTDTIHLYNPKRDGGY